MIALLALWENNIRSWSLPEILITIVIVAACIGITILALQYFGVVIPPIAVKIFWIVVVAFLAIMAIRLIAGM